MIYYQRGETSCLSHPELHTPPSSTWSSLYLTTILTQTLALEETQALQGKHYKPSSRRQYPKEHLQVPSRPAAIISQMKEPLCLVRIGALALGI